MFVICVTVYVKNEFIAEFIEASLDNAKNTRTEPLNLRFDVLQSIDDPSRFFLYEVYQDESGFSAHKETEHYRRWREIVEQMMAKPREGIKHNSIFPLGKEAFIAKI
ncbi:MAG: antibiotic biosynthesis monooxygenase [Candidatus Heimdallarchaeota archaeon]|nr:antibiotic biosynthesis monooxygenase [Candidatus Heimdallarchaeota archaeon]